MQLAAALITLTLAAPVHIVSQEWADFGEDPTSHQLSFDLDADGADELITVLFTNEGYVEVVVSEPALDNDLFPATSYTIEHFGRSASIEVVDAREAGIPLLKVHTSLEACGPYSTTWLSYQGVRGGLGRLQPALDLVGMSDPPVWATFDVQFDEANRRAVVTWTYAEDDDTRVIERKETIRYELTRSGTFVALDGVTNR